MLTWGFLLLVVLGVRHGREALDLCRVGGPRQLHVGPDGPVGGDADGPLVHEPVVRPVRLLAAEDPELVLVHVNGDSELESLEEAQALVLPSFGPLVVSDHDLGHDGGGADSVFTAHDRQRSVHSVKADRGARRVKPEQRKFIHQYSVRRNQKYVDLPLLKP